MKALALLAAVLAALPGCGGDAGEPSTVVDASTKDAAVNRARDASSADSSPDAGMPADAGLTAAAFIERYCAILAPCCAVVALPMDASACGAMVRAAATEPYHAATADAC